MGQTVVMSANSIYCTLAHGLFGQKSGRLRGSPIGAQRFGTAIIVVTHDEKIIPTFRRIYYIRGGRTYEEAGAARSA